MSVSRELPVLHLTEGLYGSRYLFQERGSFPYDLWVPTIADIMSARTAKEQKAALCSGIVSVGASFIGLFPRADHRAEYRYGLARFRITEDGSAHIAHVKTSVGNIGYQTPTEEKPTPAFAVVDALAGEYHRVIRDPEEELGITEKEVNREVAWELAVDLDNRYPGFELFNRLEAEGIEVS